MNDLTNHAALGIRDVEAENYVRQARLAAAWFEVGWIDFHNQRTGRETCPPPADRNTYYLLGWRTARADHSSEVLSRDRRKT